MTREGEPLVSFVLPCYQMAAFLELSLESLRHVRDAAGVGVEIVVVDDGSTDETAAVAEAARAWLPELRVTRRERDARSCRSLARNWGVSVSRGRYVVFLDAGVMVRPSFLDALVAAWRRGEDDVLVVSTLGLFAWQTGGDVTGVAARFRGLSPETLEAAMDALAEEPAWCERRQPLFARTQGELSRLPAPWLFAWTAALGVPRRLFDAVGGFDESFSSWGCEDCDFARRLHEIDARFRAFTQQPVLHVPHPTEPWELRRAQHLANARAMHEKRFSRESELFLILQDPFAVNLLAMRLDAWALGDLLPTWDAPMLDEAQRTLRGVSNVLFMGVPSPELYERFPRARWLVPSRPDAERAARSAGAVAVTCGVGCALQDGQGSREAVVVTDVMRLLPPLLQVAMLREAARVGKKAYLLCSGGASGDRDGTSARREREGWPWLPLDRLPWAAGQAGVVLDELTPARSPLRAYLISPATRVR